MMVGLLSYHVLVCRNHLNEICTHHRVSVFIHTFYQQIFGSIKTIFSKPLFGTIFNPIQKPSCYNPNPSLFFAVTKSLIVTVTVTLSPPLSFLVTTQMINGSESGWF